MLDSILFFLLGLIISIGVLFLRKRYRAYSELVKIRASLTKLIVTDERLSSLYPPQYIVGDLALAQRGEKKNFNSGISWMNLTDEDLAIVQTQLKSRIEWAANRTPKLTEALKYTMEKSGKMVRSRLIFLVGRILSPNMEKEIRNKLVQLAQVIELEHCASLLHDDVVDDADIRRGIPSHRKKFGDRNAVVTGDNLISVLVEILTTEICDIQVTEYVAHSIEALVIGELLQLTPTVSLAHTDDVNEVDLVKEEILPKSIFCPGEGTTEIEERIRMYLKKSYFKTASLFACLAQSVAQLVQPSEIKNLALFGFYFGVAFQLVDDMLDVAFMEDRKPPSTSTPVDKPVGGSDIRNGTVTLPVLLACMDEKNLTTRERSHLLEMIRRKFSGPSDFPQTVFLVSKSDGLMKSRQLISVYFGYCRLLLRQRIAASGSSNEYVEAMEQLLSEFESRKK